MTVVRFTERAKVDVRTLLAVLLASGERSRARSLEREIDVAVRLLSAVPAASAVRAEWTIRGIELRGLKVGTYLLIYRIVGDEVIVVAVAHSHRDIIGVLDRRDLDAD